MAVYTFLDLAAETLLATGGKMTVEKMWESAVKLGLDAKLRSKGQTPWASLGARLYVDAKDNPASLFLREPGTRPAEFSLRDPADAKKKIQSLARAIAAEPEKPGEEEQGDAAPIAAPKAGKYPYKEREIHPWLVRFARYNLGGVYSKTIYHENSSKKSYAEWLHPDLVGFWFPFEAYTREVLELSGGGFAVAKFYSFEMKRELNMGNLRESFFQAVSNSSWANEGYLAAPNIDESEDFQAELGRLSGSFGIGVIELDLDRPESSRILFPAKHRETIDWDGTNKLAKENPDFKKFLADVRIDIQNCRAHPNEFDVCPALDELAAMAAKWKENKPS